MTEKKDYMMIVPGLVLALVFGHSFLFTGAGLDVLEPMHLLALRFLLSAIIFSLLNFAGIINVNFKGKSLGPVIFLGLLESVGYFTFETLGIMHTSTSETSMFIATIPVIATLLGVVVLKEKPSLVQFSFISLTVIGAIFMAVMKDSIAGFGSNFFGTFMIFCAVMIGSVYSVYSRKFSKVYTPYELTYSLMWVGAISFNIISVVSHISDGNIGSYFTPLLNFKVLISIIYLGGISGVVGYFTLNYLLCNMEVSRSAVFHNLATVISIFAGVFFRNEDFFWFNAVGIMMILIGVWGTNYFGREVDIDVSKSDNTYVEHD